MVKGTDAFFFNKEKRSFTTCFHNVIFLKADKSVEISVGSLLVWLPFKFVQLARHECFILLKK